ncbi:phosphotransferase system HPr (HPr) family [Gottschalkia purinilytica]|uniref:Phosphocarrier protein HPr n=1 Tax=Gottschalkia purinilytica TaxID=1503 RepID=A0A0L0WAV0_GOTPU|nr:HPr family phosphocarrier protein [Gottschalkia purinilytica]KNF08577.1 phosphotransferase system HPr (HPr) family [Gottschalkia purinilytica]
MKKVRITLNRDEGLHARAASLFVKKASRYLSDIKIVKENNEYEAKSILGIMSLGAIQGDQITLVASGEDEEDAIYELSSFLQKNV